MLGRRFEGRYSIAEGTLGEKSGLAGKIFRDLGSWETLSRTEDLVYFHIDLHILISF